MEETGESRDYNPRDRRMVPKPLLEADAPWSGQHEGPGL